jgi:hypothetical protein
MKAVQPKMAEPASGATSSFFKKGGDALLTTETPFFTKSNAIQTKLTVGQPNDKFEQEADSMADQVVQRLAEPALQKQPITQTALTPFIQSKCAECEHEEQLQKKEEEKDQQGSSLDLIKKSAGGGEPTPPPADNDDDKDVALQRKCTECEEEEAVQKKGEAGTAAPELERELSASKGSGESLPAGVRQPMENAMGANFSHVKVHTGSQAVQMSKQLHAQAFTNGSDIYFNSGKYNPGSKSGQHLLAHELTHTIQQGNTVRKSPVPSIQKVDEPLPDPVPPCILSVTMTGLHFVPAENSYYVLGATAPQAMAVAVRKLTGELYTDSLARRVWAAMTTSGIGGLGSLDGEATAGETMKRFYLPIRESLIFVNAVTRQGAEVLLSTSQQDILNMGLAASNAWRDINHPAVAAQLSYTFPQWYNEDIFIQQMAQRRVLLRRYYDAVVMLRANPTDENRQLGIAVLNEIAQNLSTASSLLEAIRADAACVPLDGYGALWPATRPEPTPAGSTPPTPPPAPQMAEATLAPDANAANAFLSFINTQANLSQQAATDSISRVELLNRFTRYYNRTGMATGDQSLTDYPTTANADPLPARLTVTPTLSGPMQLEGSLSADYRFIMDLNFPDVYTALGTYNYDWNYVRVPDDQIGNTTISESSWEDPSMADVAANRFGRAGRYAVEDVATVFRDLGPAGIFATDLVMANAILRFIGTGFRLLTEALTMPRSETLIQFPEPGVYMVRCRSVAQLGDNAELIRVPSVAYMPVIIVDPTTLVESRVGEDAAARQRDMQRMEELKRMLTDPVCHANEAELRRELDVLERSLSSVGGSLSVQEQQLVEFLRRTDISEAQRTQAQEQLDRLRSIIKVRTDRSEGRDMTGAEPLTASFISDEGQSIRLTMEALAVQRNGATAGYWVSDLTTPNSSQDTGYSTNRAEAILAAITAILSGHGGYGRGYVSVNIDGVTYTRRIAASLGNLFMEALENVTTALSIAAIVAAPFTGGATLALLLPLGAIGAIPSGYRLINRALDDTLRFDMATVMDIVNIVGSVAGLAQVATPLRMVRLAKVVYIIGLGADAAGILMVPVGIISQIMELEGLPAGEKAARIMQIMGNALMNVGVMAGASVAQHLAYRSRSEHATPHETRILEETRAIQDEQLNTEQLNAELNAASRNEMNPSSIEGYDFEIQLDNGHTWRRRRDGRWCRFSTGFCYITDDIPPHLRDIIEDIAERQLNNDAALPELTERLRRRPGVAEGGEGTMTITGQWLEGGIGLFPRQIAERMRGMHFNNFDQFKSVFWMMVASDPVLGLPYTPQRGYGWSPSNLGRMRRGYAPFASEGRQTGGGSNAKWQLNHILAIERGGPVYNIDNIEIVDPVMHRDIDP